MTRFHDLDEAIAEVDGDPVVIRLFGQDWVLPTSWPAAVPLLLAKWMAEGRELDDLTRVDLLVLVSYLVPEQTWLAWEERGISVDQLAVVVRTLVAEYAATPDAEGEARPPATGASPTTPATSSTGGG